MSTQNIFLCRNKKNISIFGWKQSAFSGAMISQERNLNDIFIVFSFMPPQDITNHTEENVVSTTIACKI